MASDYAAGRAAPPEELVPGLLKGPAEFLDGALANPALQAHHLILILRNPAITPLLIQRICRSPIWMSAPRVRRTIVLNPKTPRALAMSLLSLLRWTDLARVAASPALGVPVRASAEMILLVRLPELSIGERVSLARVATSGVIRGLRRDGSPLVLRATLENPHARGEDALWVASRPNATPVMLRVLAESSRFADLQELRLAVASHPMTPPAVALRMLATLDVMGLTLLSTSSGVPMLVRLAAERRLSSEPAPDPPGQSQI